MDIMIIFGAANFSNNRFHIIIFKGNRVFNIESEIKFLNYG
jgi:hypothetical protein